MLKGENVQRVIPHARWAVDQHYDPNAAPGLSYVRFGTWLEGIEEFDATIFGVASRCELTLFGGQPSATGSWAARIMGSVAWTAPPPAILTRRSEAACIDPQARMLLENIQSLGSRGDDSRTGVYVGCMYTGAHTPVFHPCPSLHRLPAGKDAVKPSQSTWMASSRPWAWPTQ